MAVEKPMRAWTLISFTGGCGYSQVSEQGPYIWRKIFFEKKLSALRKELALGTVVI